MAAVLPVPFVLERIEDGRLVAHCDCRHGPALRPPAVDQFPNRDGLEPASEPTALLVESEFDDRLRNFGKDFLNDFIGVLGRKSAAPRDSEQKG